MAYLRRFDSFWVRGMCRKMSGRIAVFGRFVITTGQACSNGLNLPAKLDVVMYIMFLAY